MKFVKWLLVTVGILAVLLLGVAFLLPAKFHVERARELAAPPERVFAAINDLERWVEWDPWYEQDPSMALSYGEISEGNGANYSWSSEQMGSGFLEITKSVYPERIDYRIYFNGQTDRPTQGSFILEPLDDGGVRVTWTFHGHLGYPIERYVGLLLDRMVGTSFERGLERLDAATAAQDPLTPDANQ